MPASLTTGVLSTNGILGVLLTIFFGFLVIARSARTVKIIDVRPAILLGFSLAMVLGTYYFLFDDLLVKDELTWHTRGLTAASHFDEPSSNAAVKVFDPKAGYVWLVGGLYALIGVVPLIPILINIIVHSLMIISVARICELVSIEFVDLDMAGRQKATNAAAFLVAAAPSILFWVPMLLRELISGWLISLAILMALQFARHRRGRHAIFTVVVLGFLFTIRDSIGLGVSLAIVIALLFSWSQSWNRKGRAALRLFVVGPSAIAVSLFWNFASNRFGLSAADVASHSQSLHAGAESGFAGQIQVADQASYLDVLRVNLPRTLFGPYPWEFDLSGVMLLAFTEGIVWVAVVVFAWRAHPLRNVRQSTTVQSKTVNFHGTILIGVVTGSLLAMITLSTGNYGILSRLRMMPLVALAPLACIGYATWRLGSIKGRRPSALSVRKQ